MWVVVGVYTLNETIRYKYAEPNSYHITTTLSEALEAIDSECYEPSW